MDFLGDIEAALPVARRFARALIGDGRTADDMVYGCLQTALARRIQRARDGAVRSCMLRILVNRYRDMLRSAPAQRVSLAVVGGARVQSLSGGAAPAGRLSLDEMQEVIGRLPADQRAVLLLVSLESMTVEESAQILSRPRGTVLARLERARAAVGQMTGAERRAAVAAAGSAAQGPETVPVERLALFHAGDLSEPEHRAMAARIDGDPRARATLAEWRRQDAATAALYGPILQEVLPQRFRDLLDAPRTATIRRPFTLPRMGATLVAGACLAFGLGFGWGAHGYLFSSAADPTVAAARAYQTYIVDSDHAVEVPASQPDRFAAWVSSRFGEAVQAPDLTHAGFRLLGGRVLPSEAGTAVLYVYQGDTEQRLALYVVHEVGTAAKGAMTIPRFFDAGGAQGFWWQGRGLGWALAGTLSRETLQYVSALAHDQME